MITNKGKSVISKYLVGQAPSYASYMAIGCGAVPLSSGQTLDTAQYLVKDSLDFEMFRVPVISRGYVVENGTSKIVLTAQLPTEERYEITEIGLYPAATNPTANGNDSRILYSFNQSEQWEYHNGLGNFLIPIITTKLNSGSTDINVVTHKTATITDVSASSGVVTYMANNTFSVGDIVTISGVSPTDYNLSNVTITEVTGSLFKVASVATGTYVSGGTATLISDYDTDNKAFQASSDNLTFSEPTRIERKETPRYLNSSMFLRGDLSSLTSSAGILSVEADSAHIHMNNIDIDLSKSASLDKIKVAFSVISKSGIAFDEPHSVRLMLEFSSDDPGLDTVATTYARGQIDIAHSTTPSSAQHDFEESRYVVRDINIKDFYTGGTGFSWTSVKSVRVFVSVFETSTDATNGTGSPNYYVAMDGIRLENTASVNSLYGLTGYTVIKNDATYSGSTYAVPVSKEKDETHFIEFRFVADVV